MRLLLNLSLFQLDDILTVSVMDAREKLSPFTDVWTFLLAAEMNNLLNYNFFLLDSLLHSSSRINIVASAPSIKTSLWFIKRTERENLWSSF